MKYPDKKFINEMLQLIKSIMNFCEYDISIEKNELNINAKLHDIPKLILFLKDNPSISMETLIDVTAVDFPNDENRFLVVYNLLSISRNLRIKVKTKISEEISVPSITEIFPSADWYEREIWDLFGIKFSGHHDLRRILTEYDFEGHPLRKDFPLTGFVQFRYDDEMSRIVSEPVKLEQEYRSFDNLSPWEGMSKYLPGDEKSKNSDD
ncbi:MAG: NADH-quinone oxidoreductase chain 5 [Alphaproteobacteria bacterium MarineAlpha8_Bin1]|nr:MAG: NADH-quinone oxidoreductase chain 5 [Alphaproteobacteria bacterium MarineAlpha8_Bin1]|tara:strand:+ start:134 stop:757 length:624 start_codon:yes stop_codon:yes gene_type:complete